METSRIIIIGDIHGCIDELNELLDLLDIKSSDRVYSLGDLIDRGPDSAGVIKRCYILSKQCHFKLILGNHEEKFLRWVKHVELKTGKDKIMNGTTEFASLLTSLNSDEVNFMRGAYFSLISENGRAVLLHGGITRTPKFSFPKSYSYLDYSSNKFKSIHLTTKVRYLNHNGEFVGLNEEIATDQFWADTYDGSFGHIFFGHQPFLQQYPKEFAHATGMDTGCVFGGWLSAVVMENGSKKYISIKAKKSYEIKH